MLNLKRNLLLVGIAVALGVVIITGQQRGGGAGVYTTQQASTGRTAYQANCASCHQADLNGQGDAAPLRGTAFLGAWGTRSTKELLSFIQLTMPPQGLCMSIISSVQPPPFFNSFWYQASV